MKTLLALLAGSSLALFLSSCTEYSASGYYNDGYNSSYGSNSGYGYNSAVSVGIIRTSNSYWGYDPYRRSYYDYRTRRCVRVEVGVRWITTGICRVVSR
ncbi:hypothetical protein N9984_02390 [Akkermansiaceae bacterium]|nr:hypothetical protein [Akkermansiaceae bacterium]